MLGYFIVQLAGPKHVQLVVEDPQKYNFNPKELLGTIVDIYLNFAHSEVFRKAIAEDGRSYKHEVLVDAARLLARSQIRPPEHEHRFLEMADQVKEIAASAEDWEAKLGEIPDEYLDPIMSTLMRNPVMLPTSKVVCDRDVIGT